MINQQYPRILQIIPVTAPVWAIYLGESGAEHEAYPVRFAALVEEDRYSTAIKFLMSDEVGLFHDVDEPTNFWRYFYEELPPDWAELASAEARRRHR